MKGVLAVFPHFSRASRMSGDERQFSEPSMVKRSSPSRAPAQLISAMSLLLFVFGTIRTNAMRVIHIIVKTEEKQRLRIVFVLFCST